MVISLGNGVKQRRIYGALAWMNPDDSAEHARVPALAGTLVGQAAFILLCLKA